MKTGKALFGALLALLVVLALGGCATAKYVPKANEEIYGTWINEKISPQKMVSTADGFKHYLRVSDPTPLREGTGQIVSKWTDGEGNIWYKTLDTIGGEQFASLVKLSKSATVWEGMWTAPTSEQELANPVYPTRLDPTDTMHYGIYYRAAE